MWVKKKIKKRGLEDKIELQILADSEKLPFSENSFDAITAGFGVRNYENLEKDSLKCIGIKYEWNSHYLRTI